MPLFFVDVQTHIPLMDIGLGGGRYGVVHNVHQEGAQIRCAEGKSGRALDPGQFHTDACIGRRAKLAVEDRVQHFIAALYHRADLLVLADEFCQICRPLFIAAHIMQRPVVAEHIVAQHHHFLMLAAEIFKAGQGQLLLLFHQPPFLIPRQFHADGLNHCGKKRRGGDSGQGSVTVTQTKTIDGGCSYIGMVVGHMEDGILYHCNADGSIQTIGYNSGAFGDCNLPSVGGLAGVVNHGVVINYGSRVNVTTDVAVDVGGLIGLLSAGYDVPMCLLNSYCSGNIVSNNGTYVGGLVGLLQDDAVNNYFSGEITSDSSSTVGAAFGGVSNSIVDANNNSVTFEPLIRYNYYREELETIDGITGCNIISESMKLEADAVTVYTEPADLMRKVRGNMPFVNEVIGGHYGYLSSSEWAQLAELFDGANLAAGCWKDLNQPLGPCTFVNGVCIYCHALGGLEGNGTADSPYLISNIDELQWFVNQVNSGNQSIHGKLTNHIDMEGREWQTMASTGLYYKTTTYPDKGYQGTFDGNGHVISNFVIKGVPGEEATYGLFGTLSGTIKNLGVENMTFELNGAKDVRAGGIAGQMLDGSLIENCYVFNSTLAPKSYIVGGIAGCNYAGTIRSCFTCWVTIDANARCGNLVSDTRGDISATDRPGKVINCYTDGDRLVGTQTGNQVTDSEGAISGDRFASGEIAYKLGGLFGQIVKHEPCPFFGSRKVYKVPSGYRNPVERQGDAYNISNADELICFAQQVNDGLTSFNAVLTDDIVIPSDWQWTPMVLKDGDANSSTFDGQGHSITINQTYEGGSNFALFGSFNYSYIKNLTLKGSITTNSSGYVGALVGSAYRTTISNVVSYVNVTNNGTGYTGGLAGNFGGGGNRSNIENCAVYADITGNSRTGGIIGTIWNGNQPCKVTNVAYVGTVNANGSYAGAIAGYNGNQSGNTSYFTNAYYCGNSGLTHLGGSNSGTLKLDRVESKTRSAFTSGEVAYLLGDAWGQNIGTDAYPVIGGAPVYLFDNTYTNTCKHPCIIE